MAKGTLNNYPHIGVVVPDHRKGYMAPIQVDKIEIKESQVKSESPKTINLLRKK